MKTTEQEDEMSVDTVSSVLEESYHGPGLPDSVYSSYIRRVGSSSPVSVLISSLSATELTVL